MARPERLLDPTAGPLEAFAHDLRGLRRKAGNPSYRAMAQSAHYSVATLAEAARGLHKPSLKVTLAYVAACGGDVPAWVRRWHEVSQELESGQSGPRPRRPAEPAAEEPTRSGRSAAAPYPPQAPGSDPRGAGRLARQQAGPSASRAARPARRGEEALTTGERAELRRLRDELRRLRGEVAELRRANEVLKAASAIFAADLRTTAQVVYNSAGRQDRSTT
ncbi:XRE family transcriptional regulator [Streptomyces sp. NPDC101181]|uniref:XRE family transcriptional regulator n=1 Tax=Streptomyces sp. NPDC101181 TaxID=3366125 RepID=UPI00382A6D34